MKNELDDFLCEVQSDEFYSFMEDMEEDYDPTDEEIDDMQAEYESHLAD